MFKKILPIILVIALCCSLFAACAKQAPVAEPEPVEVEAEPEAEPEVEEPSANMVNPVETVTAQEQVERTGFTLTPPEGATDPMYLIISAADAEPMACLRFTYEGDEYEYRVQSTGELKAYDMSGLHYDFTTAPAKVQYCDATVGSASEACYVYWLDVVPGVNYTLCAPHSADAEKLLKVAHLIFVPVQGDADPDAPERYDFSGTYLDNLKDEQQANRITFTRCNSGDYWVEISLLRLASLNGFAAYQQQGGLALSLTDPNGNPMQATFTDAGDYTFTLTITDSQWNLLETGTEFKGFQGEGRGDVIDDEFASLEVTGDEEWMDYTGSFATKNGDNTVTFTAKKDGYDVTAQLKKYGELKGEGNDVDGAVEIAFTDPNGAAMYGIFYPENDGSFSLEFTQSHWKEIKDGTIVEGFAQKTK